MAGILFHLMRIKREANNFYKLYTLNNGQIDSLNTMLYAFFILSVGMMEMKV